MSAKSKQRILIIGLILALIGSVLSNLIETDFGNVLVKDVSFVTNDGATIAGLLYIPKDASADNPYPAIQTVHGGNSTRQAQASFSIEFARHGYVVLSIDQSKNGWSDRKDAKSSGAYYAYKYLQSLDFVDKDNIGGEGHSAGGCVTTLPLEMPELNIKSVVDLGSLPFLFGHEDYTPETCKVNVCFILGQWDENGGPGNWKVNGPKEVFKAPALKAIFGVEEDIVPYQNYGSAEDNSIRVLYTPKEFHAWMTFSPGVVLSCLDFFDSTMEQSNTLDNTDMIYGWFHVGNCLVYIGMFMAVFALLAILLSKKRNEIIVSESAPAMLKSNALYWISVVIMSVLPMLATQKLYQAGKNLFSKCSRLFSIEHQNGVMLWQFVVLAVIVLVCFITKKLNKDYDWNADKTYYKVPKEKIFRAFFVALGVFGCAYVITYLAYFFFKSPVILIKSEVGLFTLDRFKAFLVYLPFYIIYYLIAGYIHMSGLRVADGTWKGLYLTTILMNTLGVVVYALIFYVTVPLNGISLLHTSRFVAGVLINFIPGMILGAAIEVFCYKRTNNIYLGGFTNALIFTWMTASTSCMLGI